MMRLLGAALAVWFTLVLSAYAQAVLQPSFFGMDIATPVNGNKLPIYYSVGKPGEGGFWYQIETCRPANPNDQSDPCWNWVPLDVVAANYGYSIGVTIDYLILFDTPSWSQANPCHTPYNTNMPDSLTDLYNFATTITTRYAGKIDNWEMANEMSFAGDGCSTGWYSGTLASLITASAGLCHAVHAANPKAFLFTPSVFFITGEQYFANYLAQGGSTCDGVSLHTYPLFSTGDYNPTIPPEENWNQIQFYSALFSQYGLSGGRINISEGGQTGSTYDSPANGAIWLIMMTGFEYNGFQTRVMPYAWNVPSDASKTFTDAYGNITGLGQAYRSVESWLTGATVTQPPTRTAGTNGIRNPNGTGFVAGTPGTPPTDWSLSAPDSAKGVNTAILGSCVNNGVTGVSFRIWTPTVVSAGASGFTKFFLEGSEQISASLGQWWTRSGTLALTAGSLTNLTVINEWNENSSLGGNLGATANSGNAQINPIATPVTQQYSIQTIESGVTYVQPSIGFNYSAGNAFDATFCSTGQGMDTGNLWTMTITRSGGYQGLIVWTANYSGPLAYSPGGSYGYSRDVYGSSHPVIGNSVVLTDVPLLVETQQYAGWVP